MKKSKPSTPPPPEKESVDQKKRPPRDPPDTAVALQQSPNVNYHKKALETNSTMIISNHKVEMIATPKLLYKLVRVVNHFVDHIIRHYEDDESVNVNEYWYIRWKTNYPIIKSSKRTLIETHRLVHDDYVTNEKDIHIYGFFMSLLNIIPHLETCYDLLPAGGIDELVNVHRFKLIIVLFKGKLFDTNNRFAEFDSNDSLSTYKGFTANKSVTTWHTTISKASNASEGDHKPVPGSVVVQEAMSHQSDNNSQISHETNVKETKEPEESPNSKPSQITNDTNISYSVNTPKNVKFTKNQQKMRDDIIKDCTTQIDAGMNGIKSSIQNLISEQNKLLNSTIKPSFQSHHSTPIISHQSVQRNQPSPTHRPTNRPSPPNRQYHNHPHSRSSNFNTTPSYQRSGSIMFQYQSAEYELRDQYFTKHSSNLRVVKTKTDLVHFYEELQSAAISYNIFLQQFDLLQPWAKYTTNTLPPTCILTHLDAPSNTINAYNRMKNALYSKLSNSTFHDPEHKAIVKHGSIGKDGFEVLYELMTHCHPKLLVATTKIRDTNKRPELTSDDSIYSYAEKLTTWLTIESIKGLKHSDDQVLDIIMEEMRSDDKYDKGVKALDSELSIKDTFQRMGGNIQFPEHLKLYNIPSTIMSYYTEEEKKLMFPNEESTDGIVRILHEPDGNETTDEEFDMSDLVQSIINAMKIAPASGTNLTRERIDEMCEGCGMWGHNVYQTGCDRCAQYLMIKKYLEDNPQNMKSILFKYKKHQKNLAAQRQKKQNSSVEPTPTRRYNTRYSKARVKKLQDALFQAMNSDSEENDSDAYASATEDQHSENE